MRDNSDVNNVSIEPGRWCSEDYLVLAGRP